MSRLKLKCCKCGNVMETLPSSSQDIIIDEESGEMLYWNGKNVVIDLPIALYVKNVKKKIIKIKFFLIPIL